MRGRGSVNNQTYKPNLLHQTYKTKPTKPNLPTQTNKTKPAKSNELNQTKHTKPTSAMTYKQLLLWKHSTLGSLVPLAMFLLAVLFQADDTVEIPRQKMLYWVYYPYLNFSFQSFQVASNTERANRSHYCTSFMCVFRHTWCQIVCTMRFQRVSKILTPRRMLQKTWLIA